MVTETLGRIILRKKKSGIATVLLDCPGKLNFVTTEVMLELSDVLDQVARDKEVRALALLSGKSDTFASGAELNEIIKFADRAAAYQMSRQGQSIFSKLANLGKPTVVGIHGICLGGGLELALSCDRRIATAHASTQLGLPEVKLGLIPGLGGTQRLPRLIGLKSSLEIMLSGEQMSSAGAKELGIVDELVSPDDLLQRAEKAALELAASDYDRARVQQERAMSCEEKDGGLEKRKSLLAMMERSIRIRTKGQYPAPMRLIDVIRQGLLQGIEPGLQLEAETFADLAVSDVARNLIALFFSTELATRSAAGQVQRLGNDAVSSIGIIGGGVMGVGVAQLAAVTGHTVLLREVDSQRLHSAVARVNEKLPPSGNGTIAQPVIAATEIQMLTDADLVLEAVYEDRDLKTKVFKEVAAVVKKDCVIASNTSALSITKMATTVPNSQRFLGLHFFHPVDKMPLVEVISHPDAKPDALAKAMAFVSRLGKVPVAVKDGPGFLVNRLLCCYLAESARLAEQGVPLNWTEDAATGFGMPMGPFALMDEVGLDVAFTVADIVHQGCGDRLTPPVLMSTMRALGLLGRKSKSGFYDWDDTGRRLSFNQRLIDTAGLITSDQKPDEPTKERICRHLILPMIDEAARCLEEKIVRKPRDVDLAMVVGIGFPAFRGGLLRYADSLGLTKVKDQLDELYAQPGPPRQVCDLIVKMAAAKKRFYTLA